MFWRGAASNTQVDSGASLVVSSGGVASHTVISGGIMELTIGGFADDAITFAGAAGTLALDVSLYRRYRADGGKDSFWRWESAAGVMSCGPPASHSL